MEPDPLPKVKLAETSVSQSAEAKTNIAKREKGGENGKSHKGQNEDEAAN